MCEIPATKTPRILAAMKNLSTPSITHDWLLHFEHGRKVLTVRGQAKSPAWRGFWSVGMWKKLRKALEKKALSFFAKRGQEQPDASSAPQVW
jgi:hypothetical protein